MAAGKGLGKKVGPAPLWAWVAAGVGLGLILYLRAKSKASSTLPASALGSAYTPTSDNATGGGPPASPNTGPAGIDPALVSGWLSDYVAGNASVINSAFGFAGQSLGLAASSQESLAAALGYETQLSGYAVTSATGLAESVSQGAFQLANTAAEGSLALASQAITTLSPAAPQAVAAPTPSPHPTPPAPATNAPNQTTTVYFPSGPQQVPTANLKYPSYVATSPLIK